MCFSSVLRADLNIRACAALSKREQCRRTRGNCAESLHLHQGGPQAPMAHAAKTPQQAGPQHCTLQAEVRGRPAARWSHVCTTILYKGASPALLAIRTLLSPSRPWQQYSHLECSKLTCAGSAPALLPSQLGCPRREAAGGAVSHQ